MKGNRCAAKKGGRMIMGFGSPYCAAVLCGFTAVLAVSTPQHAYAAEATFDGLYVKTPVRSLFYPRSDCTRDPYWVVEDRGFRLDQQLRNAGVFAPADGRRAARVRFIGSISSPGFYGYLGAYRYEVDVKQLILASPAAPCR
jgi:hypothetical protein